MKSKLLTGEELAGLRELGREAETLEANARNLVRGLEKEFRDSDPDFPTLQIKYSDDPRVIGSAKSKFGDGRFVIAYGTEGRSLKSQLIVERLARDQRDREIWEPVMAIRLPSPEWVMDGSVLRTSGERAFVLGASVLHAIINGPGAEE